MDEPRFGHHPAITILPLVHSALAELNCCFAKAVSVTDTLTHKASLVFGVCLSVYADDNNLALAICTDVCNKDWFVSFTMLTQYEKFLHFGYITGVYRYACLICKRVKYVNIHNKENHQINFELKLCVK